MGRGQWALFLARGPRNQEGEKARVQAEQKGWAGKPGRERQQGEL